MAKKDKSPTLSCHDCIHEWACSAQCGGNPMHPGNAMSCACYEDVKGSAAYYIGFLDGKKAAKPEITYCKDCKNSDPMRDGDRFCHYIRDILKADDFCSHGEPYEEMQEKSNDM